ncbi:MAG: biotin--[acetyl-CoA-carboxylase] ligase [Acidimicrobiales bacterium]
MAPAAQPGRFADVRVLRETGSTHREVLEAARAGAPEGVVVVADHQTAGRGRRGRAWLAPPGSALLVSVLLRPRLAAAEVHLVTLAAALAAVDACRGVAGVEPSLKWPNDVVVEGEGGTGKLAGILAESLVAGDVVQAVVVGMGLNVTPAAATQPAAVCLEDLAGRGVDRSALLAAWLEHLDRWYAAVSGPGSRSEVLEAYRKGCATLGRHVRVELSGGAFEGRALDITAHGSLVVEKGGETTEVSAADVVHLR